MSTEDRKYINRPTGYDNALAGPYLQQDVSMRGYFIHAEKEALQGIADRYLNLNGSNGVHYKPIAPYAAVVMADMKRVSAGDPELGQMREMDCAVFVPLFRFHGADPIPKGFAVFAPYLFVDNDWALITGRDGGLGFRKNLGLSFSDAEDVENAGMMTHLDAYVVNQRGRDSRMTKERLVSLQLNNPESGASHETVGSMLKHVLEHLLGKLAGDALEHVLHWVSHYDSDAGFHLPMVFLKQYRATKNGQLADVQEVFEANAVLPLNSFRGGQLITGEHRVTIANPVSHPIAEELGVHANTALPIVLAAEIDCDFSVELPK